MFFLLRVYILEYISILHPEFFYNVLYLYLFQIIWINEKAEKELGWFKEEVKGKDLSTLHTTGGTDTLVNLFIIYFQIILYLFQIYSKFISNLFYIYFQYILNLFPFILHLFLFFSICSPFIQTFSRFYIFNIYSSFIFPFILQYFYRLIPIYFLIILFYFLFIPSRIPIHNLFIPYLFRIHFLFIPYSFPIYSLFNPY